MYAIVEIAGKQYRVSKDMKLKIPLQKTEPGKDIDIERVLALEDDQGNVSFGTPILANSGVTAKVIEHGREKKIIVFKKKRRKGYQKKNGHRQGYSLIEITAIASVKKAKPAAKAEEKVEKPVAEKKATRAKAKAKPTAAKKTSAKATVEKPKKAAVVKPKAKPAAAKTAKAESKTKTTTAKKKTTPKKDVKED